MSCLQVALNSRSKDIHVGHPPRAGAPYDPGYGRGLEGWEEGDTSFPVTPTPRGAVLATSDR